MHSVHSARLEIYTALQGPYFIMDGVVDDFDRHIMCLLMRMYHSSLPYHTRLSIVFAGAHKQDATLFELRHD